MFLRALLFLCSFSIFALEVPPDELKRLEITKENLDFINSAVTALSVQYPELTITSVEQLYDIMPEVLLYGRLPPRQDAWGEPWVLVTRGSLVEIQSTRFTEWVEQVRKEQDEILLAQIQTNNGESFITDIVTVETTDDETQVTEEGVGCNGVLFTESSVNTQCGDITIGAQVDISKAIIAPVFATHKRILDINSRVELKDIITENPILFNSDFGVDLLESTILKDLRASTVTYLDEKPIPNVFADLMNGNLIITKDNLADLVVTQQNAGTNIDLSTRIGQSTVSVIDNPVFNSVTTIADAHIAGRIYNPASSNTTAKLSIGDDILVSSNFYLPNSLNISNTSLNISPDAIYYDNDLRFNLGASVLTINAATSAMTIASPAGLHLGGQMVFNPASDTATTHNFGNVFTVDTINGRVGLNDANPAYTFSVKGRGGANSTIVTNSLSMESILNINASSPGLVLPFNNDTANPTLSTLGLYSGSGNPYENFNFGEVGSLFFDNTNALLYVKTRNFDWQQLPFEEGLIKIGGDSIDEDTIVGSNDNFGFILETNNIPAITIDRNQNTTFHGNANFDLNDVNNINNLSVSNIQANDNTNILDITLHNDNVNAFRMRDTDGVPFIMIDTSAATGNLITQGTTTFTTNLLTADIVDINGGTIDGITAGSNVPYTSLAVASLTFTGNQIDSILDNTINFTDNNLTTSGTVTTGNIDVSNNNITNVTNIDLAAITSNTDTFTISLEPNKPIALQITDGTNDYLNIDTTTTLPTLNITQRTNFAANTVVGSDFEINGGTIDNTIIGATTPVEATVTTLTATTLGGPLNVNNQVLSNVIINTGTINVQALTSTIATLGDISISGNTITTTANTLDIVPSTTIGGTLTAKTIDNNNGTLTNVGTLYTTNINPNTETLTVNLGDSTQALVIRDDIAPIITIDTDSDNIIIAPQFATTFNGLLTAQDVDINGGDIDIQSLISTVAALGNIRIVGNTITTTNNQAINFGATDLTTSGTLTAGGLAVAPNNLDVGVLAEANIHTIIGSQTLTLDLQNNANAFTVKDTDSTFIQINTIDNEITQGTTTFTSNLLTADNVDINGGDINIQALTSTVATLGDLNITGNTITTTANTLDIVPSTTIIGTLTAKTIDNTNGTINNVDTLYTANINPNTDTLDINLESNARALDIKDDNVSFITIDTTIPLITQGTTTFTSNRLTADNVEINGGTIEVSALTSTVATLGNITFSADTMRSSSGQIDFGATDLTTTGTITANALVLPVGLNLDVGEVNVENITASSNTLTINLKDNESVALRITDNDQDFIIIDTDNNSITQGTTTFTSNLLTADNVDINGGDINIQALTSTVATLGDLNITGNTITTTANTLDIVPSTTIIGTLTAKTIDNTNGTINNVDTLYTANINPNTDTLDINLESNARALDIKDDNVSFITIDTTIPLITQGTTTFTSNRLTADNVEINGGTIEVSALTSTVATLGNITFSADTMRSSSGQIDFGATDLTTTGTITANALVLPVVLNLDVGEVDVENITASSNTLTINLKDNESVALRITDNDQDFIIIDTDNNSITQGTTTFTSNLLTADNVDINGGDINIQALTSTVATLGGINIVGSTITSSTSNINFGSSNIITTGSITGNIILVNNDYSGINRLLIDNITSTNAFTLTLTDNLNPAFTITDGNTPFMTINTNGNQITQHATNFTGTVRMNDAQITGGSISNVDINANRLTVDNITIDGNQINSDNNNNIRFSNTNLVDIDNLTANSIDVSGGTISNVGSLITNAINPNANLAITLNNNANAFTISEGGTNFITIDTTNDLITQAATNFTGAVNISTVDIDGGTLDNVDITANRLTVDDITIDGNQITASGGTIDFTDDNLTTRGTLTANSIDVSGGTISNVGSLITNAINPNANLAITLNNNANAFTISEGGTNFITIDTTNDLITQATTTFTGLVSANNVNITGGSLSNVGINATALTVDQITIDNNQITASGGTIDFTDDNLTTRGTVTVGGLDVNGIDLTNLNAIEVNTINPNTGGTLTVTLTDNLNPALTITDGATSFITIDTTNDLITQATTTFTGLVSANNVNITGGSLSNVGINATALTVDQITIDNNQITASGGTIDFTDENLTTRGTLTANSIDVSGGTISNVGSLITNAINPNANLAITLNNNANAFTISEGGTNFITIDTTNDLITQAKTTFTGLVSANNVNITGGTLSNVALDATALTVDQITIDNNQITASGGTIDFTDENLTTRGTLTANNIDVSGGTISNVGSLITNAINPNTGGTLTVTLTDNLNPALTITDGATSFITIDTTNELITQATTTFTGNITANNNLTVNGLLTASNVDINGGAIDGVTLGTNSPITELVVDNITINGQITSDSGSINFDNENLTTTGSITAGTMITDTIRSTSNLAVNTTGNFNINTTLFVNGSNIGIGTNTPNTFLHVSGDTDSSSVATIENTSTNANARGLDIELAATTNNNARFIQFSADNTVVGAIQYQTGAFQVVNVSDRKTKTNITDTTLDAVGILSNLRVVDYHRKTNPTGSKITGFIAQEVQPIFSNMVTNVNRNLLGINETALIPVLVKGFQAQQDTLTTLTDAVEVSTESINLTKELKVNNTTVVDTNNNLFGNTLTLEDKIQTTKDKFSIKRFDNDQLSTLMTLNMAKIQDINAKGYLSVKDVYLSSENTYLTQMLNSVKTGSSAYTCTNETIGNTVYDDTLGRLMVCFGNSGWKFIK